MRQYTHVLFFVLFALSNSSSVRAQEATGDERNQITGKKPLTEPCIDLLRPEEEKLRRAFYAMLDEMRENKVRPDVSVQVKKTIPTPFSEGGYPFYVYSIRLPEKYRAFDKEYGGGRPRHRLRYSYFVMRNDAVRDPKYTYYAVLLILGETSDESSPLPGIDGKSPDEWNKYRDSYVERFGYSLDFDLSLRDLHQFYMARERLDRTGATRLELPGGGYGSPNTLHNHWDLSDYREMLEKRDRTTPLHSSVVVAARTGDAIVEKEDEKRAVLVKALPRDKTQDDAFASFFCLCSAEKGDLLLVTRTVVEYLRAAPKLTPVYSDMAMALFVSRGYAFDRKAGTYTPNDAGKALLDYIVEHPNDHVMGDLKVLHEHGCADLLTSLVGKHHPKVKTWTEFCRVYEPDKKATDGK